MTLTVIRKFEVTTTPSEKIFANQGDIITVKDKGAEEYYILRINKQNIFSKWMRKSWVNSHCKAN